MALNKGSKILKELMAMRNQVSTSREANKSQVPANLPHSSPQIPKDLGLKPLPEMKKKRPNETLEEGEVGPKKGKKQQKVVKDSRGRRSPSIESQDESLGADITQQVFVAEEWVKDACNEARAEAQSRSEVEKTLGNLRQDQDRLFEKLKEAIKAKDSADAGFKIVEKQAEDQLQKLHIIEIDLATERQLVKDLRVELQKAKEAA
nr:tropomyosin alpha-1 chain-like [Quercus suber]